MTVGGESSPTYLESPVVDALTHVVCELTAQLCTLKRRLQMLEDEVVVLGGRPLDAVEISDDDAAASARAAKEFVESVLQAFNRVTSE